MDDAHQATSRKSLRVVLADDDSFTVSLVAAALEQCGFEVHAARTVAEAATLVRTTEPNALVSDLDFGDGTSGVSLLRSIATDYPWIALIALTAHQSPSLAVQDSGALPDGVSYLVKSRISRPEDLGNAVHAAIAGRTVSVSAAEPGDYEVTANQASILRQLAEGATTRVIAERRGTSVRAVESMLTRLYTTLEIDNDGQSPRTVALRMWAQGRIRVR
jgi:DNA-binding NarL/FixJ family response regulator